MNGSGAQKLAFPGLSQASWRGAVIRSIIGSCWRRSLNSKECFTNVPARLLSTAIIQIRELLPALKSSFAEPCLKTDLGVAPLEA